MTDSTRRPTILILGGTSEARKLAAELHQRHRAVVTSLAGRVSQPRLPPGEVRIGGFGGPEGLARWLQELGVTAVVDATHPFAEQISAHARDACRATHKPLLRLDRPAWTAQPDDRWHRVAGLDEAAMLAPHLGRRIFLTIGRQNLAAFGTASDPWYLIRCVEPPEAPLPAHHEIILARGPFSLPDELDLLRRRQIDVLVTRDSGGAPTEAKLAAARTLGLPVVIVDRPIPPDVRSVRTVDEAVTWVLGLRE